MGKINNILDEMYTEAARLKTFKNWPFGEASKCSATNMAEAGFFHCAAEKEPDVVQCYVCFKELDGWDENDEPWNEHLSHSRICLFAKIGKPQRNLTVSEIYQIEAERKNNKVKKLVGQRLQVFKNKCEEINEFNCEMIEELGTKKK